MTGKADVTRRPGRRPGKQDTRETILASAKDAFADRGYDGTSIRQVAASAKVDPALVHHYFGTKEKLFRSVMAFPIDPDELVPEVFAAGVEAVPERLVRTFLGIWESPVSGPVMRGMVRSAVSHGTSARLVREFFATQIVRRVAKQLGDHVDPKEIPFRASLVASQLFGLAMIRYILKFEPLASADPEDVVAAAAPNVRHFLLDHLSDAPLA